jgi:hypothetical protein
VPHDILQAFIVNDRRPPGYSRFAPAILVIAIFVVAEAALARRNDLTDHGRYTAAVYMTAARNYARYGFLQEGGAPLANGGALEVARQGRYLNWPVRDFMELGAWFRIFGAEVRVARAQTLFWSVLALVALAWAMRSALWPLALATSPFFIYYAHAACPQAVTVAAIAVAAAGRLVRLRDGGRFPLAVQAFGVFIAVTTTWEGLLFPVVWAISDLRARRRDGLLLLAFASAVIGLEVAYLLLEGGWEAWRAKALLRASSPGPLLHTVVRVARYGRSLGYGHVLLAFLWLVWIRKKSEADRVALELLLAPSPWFLVFREHVAVHDVEMFYFAPGVSLAATLALESLATRRFGKLRLGLALAMLVGTGSVIGGVLEHKDDLTLPHALGEIARHETTGDQAFATSTEEFSVAWESDRFVHTGVRSLEELSKLSPAPVCMIVPEPSDREVAEAERDSLRRLVLELSRYPVRRRDRALVFDLTGIKEGPR